MKGCVIIFKKWIVLEVNWVIFFDLFIVICLGYNLLNIIEMYVNKVKIMILVRFLVVVLLFNIGVKWLDKVFVNEVLDRILIKVIFIWIVDKKLLGFCNILSNFWVFVLLFFVFCFIWFLLIDMIVIFVVVKKVLINVNMINNRSCVISDWFLGLVLFIMFFFFLIVDNFEVVFLYFFNVFFFFMVRFRNRYN